MMTADGDLPAELSKLQKGYELLGELSRDRMLIVYVARDKLSGKEVTIKVLRAADARGREALAHYASDARLLTALEHPNIVAVNAVKWLSEDVVAVVTERVRGPTLRQVLDVAGTLPVARATEVLRGLGRALAWAHSSQIMHRDVRPENVIFEDGTGRVVLLDFGLARRIEGATGTTEPGADAYRAPELSDGRYPDRRTDVYSLGIVGWELLTGRRPWPDTMDPIEPGRVAPDPPPLAEVRPGLPAALVAAIEGAVQLDRDRRIPDVVTFMERLTKVAPPAPQPDEEPADDVAPSLEPTEWVALPVPRMPRKAPRADGEHEVPLELERKLALGAAPTAEPGVGRQVEPAANRPVEREAERAIRPTSPESFAPPSVRERPAATGEQTAAAAAPSAPMATPVPPAIPLDSKRRGPKTGGEPSDVAASASAAASPEEPTAQPASASSEHKTSVRAAPAASELPADRATAAGLAAAAAAASQLDAAGATRPAPQPSIAKPPATERPSLVPTDVELPPPEPVRFADLPSEPLRGPVSGPVRGPDRGPARAPAGGASRAPARLEGMRGGLATPREPKTSSHGREAPGGVPLRPPLQPVWDTPAELPLPPMPDPRPMPAETGAGWNDAARRRLTRRNVAIAAVALLLVVAALTLARMERTRDTAAELIEPEVPTGYGGDVILAPDTAASAARPMAGGERGVPAAAGRTGGDARASDDPRVSGRAPASADARAPADTLTAASPRTPRDTATRGGARTPAGARAPGAASTPARQPAGSSQPTGSPPAARQTRSGGDPAPANAVTPPPASARPRPVVGAEPAGASPTASRPDPTGSPCNSPALADQRACLAAHVQRSDAPVDEVYADVIAAMRQRANSGPGDPDPPEVQRLRAAQRDWLARRDAVCRRRGRGREGPLWATSRAQCLAAFSADRTRDLSATLARLRRD